MVSEIVTLSLREDMMMDGVLSLGIKWSRRKCDRGEEIIGSEY